MKLPTLLVEAARRGCTLRELLGIPGLEDRVEAAGCAASNDTMRRSLVGFLELDAWLDDYGVA